MRPNRWLVLVLVGAAVGLVFAGLSTYDFVQHLDRQVHSVHCSFIPGLGHSPGESGCQVAMMSEYSSVFRGRVWGGIPIALPAMAVFAFIGLFAIDLLLTRRKHDPLATGFLALATGLPAVVSIVMLGISLSKLGTTCKLCVCIYIASALCLAGAIGLWRRAVAMRATGDAPIVRRRAPKPSRAEGADPAWMGATPDAKELEPAPEPARRPLAAEVDAPAASMAYLGGAFGAGVLFVVVPIVLYLGLAPDHGRFVGTCDTLIKPDDTYGVMVKVGEGRPAGDAAPAIELLDPLCPACAAFEHRLVASGAASSLDRRAILFPLDSTCNWMVTETTHPGACTISEAVLCAETGKAPGAAAVIAWAFEHGERIRTETKADPGAAARIVKQQFPELASCIGSPEAKARLNKSLRWAVANNIRVLTPQLYVDNVKLCDEDVDLGLEYALKIMLERHANHTLAPTPVEAPATKPAVPSEPSHPDTAARPATDKPATDRPATDKPATDKPATDKPAGDPPDPPKPEAPRPEAPKPTEPANNQPVTQPSASDGSGGAP